MKGGGKDDDDDDDDDDDSDEENFRLGKGRIDVGKTHNPNFATYKPEMYNQFESGFV